VQVKVIREDEEDQYRLRCRRVTVPVVIEPAPPARSPGCRPMAALIPNIAKGKVAYYAGLPAANDALIWVLFYRHRDRRQHPRRGHLTAVIATSLDEATFTGYSRVTAPVSR
jgi:hypothetical protein